MINEDDLAQMRADLLAVRSDNEVSIVIRRGSTTLEAQTVRVAQSGQHGNFAQSGQAKESRSRLIVLGSTTLDIQPDDRFTLAGKLYSVVHVQPNRLAGTTAEAEVSQ